jgi:hypothetical protein
MPTARDISHDRPIPQEIGNKDFQQQAKASPATSLPCYTRTTSTMKSHSSPLSQTAGPHLFNHEPYTATYITNLEPLTE